MNDCVFLKIAALLTQFIFSKHTIQHATYFNNHFLCSHGKLPVEAWGTKMLPFYAQEGGSEALGSHRVTTQPYGMGTGCPWLWSPCSMTEVKKVGKSAVSPIELLTAQLEGNTPIF